MSIGGPLEQLTAGVGPELQPHAVSSNRIAFSTQMENLDLWSLDINADTSRVPEGAELKRLTNHAGEDSHPSLSADGNKVAFVSTRSGNPDIWLMDLQTRAEINLTATPGEERWPKTGLTASRVAYGTRPRGSQDWTIYTVETEGALTRRKSCEDCGRPLDWCSTGDYILYVRGQTKQSVWLLEEKTSQKLKLLEHPEFDVIQARPDPLDRWIAFTVREEPLRARVYIAPFRMEDLSEQKGIESAQWIPVTDGEGWDGMARWSPNGNFLYFVSDREGSRGIWVQRLEASSGYPSLMARAGTGWLDGHPTAIFCISYPTVRVPEVSGFSDSKPAARNPWVNLAWSDTSKKPVCRYPASHLVLSESTWLRTRLSLR